MSFNQILQYLYNIYSSSQGNPCPSNPKWQSIYQETCMKRLDTADGLPTTQMAAGFTPPIYDTNPYISKFSL